MPHRLPNLKFAIPALSILLLTGCFHESWSYRAAPNLNIARTNELGSEGPLVLVLADKPDVGARADSASDVQLAMVDPVFQAKLEQKKHAAEAVEKWQSNLGDQHPRVIEARLTLAEATDDVSDYSRQHHVDRKSQGAIPPPLKQEPKSSPQTVLVVSVQRDFGKYDNSIGRSVVMFLDGPPTPGQYWMNADNSVLITYSAWSAPARSRVALDGSVKILRVTERQVIADVAFRENSESDSTEWVAHMEDPVYWQAPWIVTRRCVFQMTTTDDPAWGKAAVKWVTHSDGR
jgi:hypothetical protein